MYAQTKSTPTMEKQGSNFYLTAKKFWKTVVNKEAGIDTTQLQLQIEMHKRMLSIFHAGNYYYLLFNIYRGEIEHTSVEVANVLGYTPEEMTIHLFMEAIHPADKPYFLCFENKAVKFFYHVCRDKIKNYKIQYDLRLKTKHNKYIRLLIQYLPLDYDQKNFYRSFHIHTDITHIKPDGIPRFSIIGLDGEPSYYNIQDAEVFTKYYDLFTRREREILKLVVEGKDSKTIADELYISLHTVNTHRKNILKKAGTKTTLDLLKKVIGEAWM